jgi:DNA-binding Lrp family transcriptional regulator
MTTDAKILSALRANPDGVSGAQLAEQLKISRAAIWSRIEELRRLVLTFRGRPALWLPNCRRTGGVARG